MNVELGYEPLANVLQEALAQAATGKGKERHANGKPILEQPIMVKSRESGPGGPFFQASKKLLEALNCLDDERAIRDLLGAINYTAAMVLLRREGQEKYLRENAAGQVYAGILPTGYCCENGIGKPGGVCDACAKTSADYQAAMFSPKAEDKPAGSLDDDHPLWCVNEQIKDILDGLGATTDHKGVRNFLLSTGLPEGTVHRMHVALVALGSLSHTDPPKADDKPTHSWGHVPPSDADDEPVLCAHLRTKSVDPETNHGWMIQCHDCGAPLRLMKGKRTDTVDNKQPATGKAWYGPGGALVTDSPLGSITQELTPEAANYYGAPYLIAETVSRIAARTIATALHLDYQASKGE